MTKVTQRISPCLWFNDNAEEAVNFYMSIFSNSKIIRTTYYEAAGAKVSGRPQGSVMTILFLLNGQEFLALNGGPAFKFTEAISLMINCSTQKEVDELWEKLSVGGEKGQCGWLKDKFGLSWQVVPTVLGGLMTTKDTKKADRVMQALLQMHKLDIKKLEEAAR